ncbi:MAG: hypothetical protein ABIJ08_04920 [Nanoarchaeota archaeon]
MPLISIQMIKKIAANTKHTIDNPMAKKKVKNMLSKKKIIANVLKIAISFI